MWGSLFKCKLHSSHFNDIPPHEPPLQASSSLIRIPRIRIWLLKYVAFDWFRRRILHAFNLAIRFGLCKMRRLNRALHTEKRVNYLHRIINMHFDSRLLKAFKVAQNSFQHIQRLRFWCVIIATLYQLMLQSWYQKTAQSLVNTLVLFSWHDRLP